ncbi:MAG TPA: nitrite reductase small subunit NirD [Jiangellaceae bacterium]
MSIAVETVRWTPICTLADLQPERGVAALVDGIQVAIFRTHDGRLYAIGNRDPFSDAYVLSRGIVGNRREVPTVASPMHKQAFDLRTGRCLDDETVAVPTYPIRLVGDVVEVVPA